MKLIDTFPTNQKGPLKYCIGRVFPFGATGAPMINPPLLDSIANDAVLGNSLLIAEAWDAGGLYQVGTFRYWGKWAEWNGKYRDCLRRFIKGGAEHAPELYLRIVGSADIYGESNSESSINFITCHDGFTLYDLVSYNDKHNESNGENNMDGTNDNNSWNCGIEGETNNACIQDLRIRQMKNMLTILLTSRGIPMLLSGDEFANTQFGNNNAYCHDSEISWLDWSNLERHKDLFEYVQKLLSFRKKHPVLRSNTRSGEENSTGYPEFSLHSTTPWQLDTNSPSLCFAYMYVEDAQKYGTKKTSFIYVAVNAHWELKTFNLPVIPAGFNWKAILKSSRTNYKGESHITIDPRSTAILIAQIKS